MRYEKQLNIYSTIQIDINSSYDYILHYKLCMMFRLKYIYRALKINSACKFTLRRTLLYINNGTQNLCYVELHLNKRKCFSLHLNKFSIDFRSGKGLYYLNNDNSKILSLLCKKISIISMR